MDVRTGYKISVRGDDMFPAASIIKLPVMSYLFYLADRQSLSLNERIKFLESDKCPEAGMLQWLKPTPLPLRRYCKLMISISDNTATRVLVKRLGKNNITSYVRKLGLSNTYVRDETALSEPPSSKVNITTANDIAKLLYRIERGIRYTAASRKEMISYMIDQKYRFGIPFPLPGGFICANKTGNLTNVLHDTAIVYTNRGSYILCVFTKGFKKDRNARFVINDVSKVVSEYYY